MTFFIRFIPSELCKHLSPTVCAICPVHRVLFDLITIKIFTSTIYESPHYVILSSLLLLRPFLHS
jgi:hypothetical protein